jgi:hypothetical protein
LFFLSVILNDGVTIGASQILCQARYACPATRKSGRVPEDKTGTNLLILVNSALFLKTRDF